MILHNKKSQNVALVLILLGTIAFFFYCLLTRAFSLNGDSAMYLYAGDLFLAGQRPFVDFFDINPPLITYLSALSIYLSHLVKIPPPIFFKIAVGIAALFSLASTVTIGLKFKIFTFKQALLLFILSMIVLINQIFLYSYGERDHLFALALMPYMLLRFVRLKFDKPTMSFLLVVPISLWMGLTTAFKPYFLIYFLIIELFIVTFKTKKDWKLFFSTEVVLVLIIQFIYLLHLILLPEPAHSNFWHDNVNLVLKYYSSYNYYLLYYDDPYRRISVIMACIASVLILFAYRKMELFQKFISTVMIAALISFIIQLRWFPYQASPIEAVQAFCVIVFICVNDQSIKSIYLRSKAHYWLIRFQNLILISIFCTFLSAGYLYLGPSGNGRNSFFLTREFLKGRAQPGDYVLPLTPSNTPDYTIVSIDHLKMCSRYLFQYPLSFFGSKRFQSGSLFFDPTDTELSQQEQKYFQQLREDIQKFKPKVIWFYQKKGGRAYGLPKGFPVLEYLQKVGLIDSLNDYYENIKGPEEFIIFALKK